MEKYYSSVVISPTLTRIDCLQSEESCYLVRGSERAALVDAGSGLGNLAAYVKGLTGLPVSLVMTHGHVDHIGGAMGFACRYLSTPDWDLAREHGSYQSRLEHLRAKMGDRFREQDVQPFQVEGFLPLEDGQVFELGGVSLTAIALPGHSRGSVAILHRQERRVILGDACNTLTFLFFPDTPSVEEYQENLARFCQRWGGSFDHVHFSHFEQAGKGVVEENIRVCQDILDGRADDIPLNIPLTRHAPEQPYIAKAILGHPKQRRRADGGQGNIVYSRRNVFRKTFN